MFLTTMFQVGDTTTTLGHRWVYEMSNFCPCCDDFSIDASRARRKTMAKKKPFNINDLLEVNRLNITVDKKKKTLVINVDDSEENADWIKKVKKGKKND